MELETMCPWKEHMFELFKELDIINGDLKFVIFQCRSSGTWRVQAIPVASSSFVCQWVYGSFFASHNIQEAPRTVLGAKNYEIRFLKIVFCHWQIYDPFFLVKSSPKYFFFLSEFFEVKSGAEKLVLGTLKECISKPASIRLNSFVFNLRFLTVFFFSQMYWEV